MEFCHLQLELSGRNKEMPALRSDHYSQVRLCIVQLAGCVHTVQPYMQIPGIMTTMHDDAGSHCITNPQQIQSFCGRIIIIIAARLKKMQKTNINILSTKPDTDCMQYMCTYNNYVHYTCICTIISYIIQAMYQLYCHKNIILPNQPFIPQLIHTFIILSSCVTLSLLPRVDLAVAKGN